MGTHTLTKAELSALLFKQLGFNKKEASDFVDAFFETMLAQLAHGEDSIGTGGQNSVGANTCMTKADEIVDEIQYKNCIDAIKILNIENRTLKVWMGKNA